MATRTTARPTARKTAQASSTAPRGRSLHIGLNAVDPAAYAGWDGPLAACEFDAHDMAAVARSRQIRPTLLLTRQATRAAVLKALRAAAKASVKGDLFLLSYSGHGGQVPDTSGDEPDRQDETWCLFDGQLIDDELYAELGRFAAGVRVLVCSDSCHSGSVTRGAPVPAATAGARPRWMPAAVGMRTYAQHQAFYDGLQQALAQEHGRLVDPDTALAQVAASPRLAALQRRLQAGVVLISGCQDNQTSMDGEHNGAFTEQLLKVWNHGRFAGNLAQFHQRILAGMPPTQSPRLYTLGPVARFLSQPPFQV